MKAISPLSLIYQFKTRIRTNRTFAWLVGGYFLLSLLLFFYSFTQIDLNLTLVSYPLIHNIQKPFIYYGYYLRPLSTITYVLFLLGYFGLFLATLFSIHKKRLSPWEVGALVLLIAGLLLFSYPAFSHDIFNYMFDAKIFTHYGDNPYAMRALDYPQDPWIRFMHWTHRTYPYGPVFLPISIFLSFIGMNIFPVTLVLFKGVVAIAYLGTVWFLYKILIQKKTSHPLAATAFFAFNPLVIFETLVSGHHDMIMMFFAIFAVSLYLQHKKILSFLFFLLSVGIKYVTVFLAPLYVLGVSPLILLTGAVAATITIILKLGLQPWYLLWVLPFASLVYSSLFVRVIIICLSFVFLLRYLPFLYTGEWPRELMTLHNQMVLVTLILACIGYGLWWGVKGRGGNSHG